VPEVAGAYVATGHSVWGILDAPATGEAMAELILDGAAHTVDLKPFDPGRMPPFDCASLRMNANPALSRSRSRRAGSKIDLSFARDRRFESGSLQRGVCKVSFPRALPRSNQWRSRKRGRRIPVGRGDWRGPTLPQAAKMYERGQAAAIRFRSPAYFVNRLERPRMRHPAAPPSDGTAGGRLRGAG
jgi:hypothetical protein